MSYPINKKIVIGVSSSALFSLGEAELVYDSKGIDSYRKYQREHEKSVLDAGVAFPFIRRFLNLNKIFPNRKPVEVVLLSKNDPDTGQRVFHSIKSYGLDISRGCFLAGKSPCSYIPAFNISLFLSANQEDVTEAVKAGYPAGRVLKSKLSDTIEDEQLRIAFDFDGVIVDDQAEKIFNEKGLDEYEKSELEKVNIPHQPGPLEVLLKQLSFFQKYERRIKRKNSDYTPILKTAIITARCAPASERLVTTLRNWDITVDETFFLGGIDKKRVLELFRPHIFFDDQLNNIESASENIPSVHVPFGIKNY